MTDAKAFIAWLDQQSAVAKNRKMGTQGYCMGGPMAFRTAAAVPDRVGAVASFHGGGLVTTMPEQSASAGGDQQGAVPYRHRRERRYAGAERQGRLERDVRQGEPARGDRGLHRLRARLVSAGFGGLQRSRWRRRRGAGCSCCTARRSPERASPFARVRSHAFAGTGVAIVRRSVGPMDQIPDRRRAAG